MSFGFWFLGFGLWALALGFCAEADLHEVDGIHTHILAYTYIYIYIYIYTYIYIYRERERKARGLDLRAVDGRTQEGRERRCFMYNTIIHTGRSRYKNPTTALYLHADLGEETQGKSQRVGTCVKWMAGLKKVEGGAVDAMRDARFTWCRENR